MCNMMDGLVPVSSLLLIRLLPCRITSGSACVTGIAATTISWRRRWHRRVAATARLWCSRCTISRSCSPPLPTRCGVRFSLLLLPLPPSVCPLDDLAPFSTLGCKLRRAPTRNRQQRAPQAGNGGYATVPPPRPGDSSGSNILRF